MMQHDLLILSDCHGNRLTLRAALAAQLKAPHGVIFLGDGLRDLACLDLSQQGINLYAVRGNCDGFDYSEPNEPQQRLLTLGNVKMCLMHGHTHHVKSGWQMAAAHAATLGADILLFGHTHTPLEEHLPAGTTLGGVTLEKPLTLFNPGTIAGGWGRRPTFGTLTIRDGSFILGHGEVTKF